MKADTINALGMILMAVFTVAIIIFFRTKPIRSIHWKVKVPLAIGGAVFTLILYVFTLPNKMCIEVPEPFGQIELAMLCVMCLILFVNRIVMLSVCCVLVFWVGGMLDCQIKELARYSNEYTTLDADTHRPMAKGCSENQLDMDIVALTMSNTDEGIVAEKLWHTFFTGIYRIKK
jgi:hypothetical protein